MTGLTCIPKEHIQPDVPNDRWLLQLASEEVRD